MIIQIHPLFWFLDHQSQEVCFRAICFKYYLFCEIITYRIISSSQNLLFKVYVLHFLFTYLSLLNIVLFGRVTLVAVVQLQWQSAGSSLMHYLHIYLLSWWCIIHVQLHRNSFEYLFPNLQVIECVISAWLCGIMVCFFHLFMYWCVYPHSVIVWYSFLYHMYKNDKFFKSVFVCHILLFKQKLHAIPFFIYFVKSRYIKSHIIPKSSGWFCQHFIETNFRIMQDVPVEIWHLCESSTASWNAMFPDLNHTYSWLFTLQENFRQASEVC